MWSNIQRKYFVTNLIWNSIAEILQYISKKKLFCIVNSKTSLGIAIRQNSILNWIININPLIVHATSCTVILTGPRTYKKVRYSSTIILNTAADLKQNKRRQATREMLSTPCYVCHFSVTSDKQQDMDNTKNKNQHNNKKNTKHNFKYFLASYLERIHFLTGILYILL